VLHEGNLRYQRGKLQLRDYSVPGEYTANRQMPFAAIITCADSRLSPPLVFDLHHGNVFVSRSRATASTWGLWVIVPAIRALPPPQRTSDRSVVVTARTQAADLATRTPIIKQAIGAKQIEVVAAVYDIRSGKVSLV